MNSAIIPICVVTIFAFWVAVAANYGKTQRLEGWAVGNRNFGTILVFILMGGELYTTFTFLGGSSLAYNKGGVCYYILCYSPIAYILGYWLAPAIWKYAKEHNLVSQADFFIHKYNSRTLGMVVSVIGFLSLIPYLILQIKGLGIIVSETSYGLISANTAIWICSLVMVIYVMISGMHGSVRVAVVKDILILATVFFLGIYLPIHYFGGIESMINTLESTKPTFTIVSSTDFNPVWFVSTVLLSAIGLYMWPHGFTSLYTARSSHVLKRNAIVMPLYQFLLMFVFIIGFVAVLKLPGLDKSQSDLVLLKLVKQTFNPWVVGIIGAAGVLTALVPGSIILLSLATLLVKNILSPFTSLSAKREFLLVRFSVPIIMLIALAAYSYGGQTIVSLLIVGYGLVSQLFPAIIFSFSKRNLINKYGAIVGMLSGTIFMLISILTPIDINHILPSSLNGMNNGIIALIINVIVMFTVSVIFKNRSVLR